MPLNLDNFLTSFNQQAEERNRKMAEDLAIRTATKPKKQEIPSLASPKKKKKELSSFSKIQKSVYKNALEPLEKKVERVATNFTGGMLTGIDDGFKGFMANGGKKIGLEAPKFVQDALSKPKSKTDKVIDKASQFAGTIAPISLSYKVTAPVVRPIVNALPKVGKLAIPSKILGTGIRGATAMGTYGTAREGLGELINPNEATLGERAKRVKTDVIAGAVLDPAFSVGGMAVKKGLEVASNRTMKNLLPNSQQVENTLRNSVNSFKGEQALPVKGGVKPGIADELIPRGNNITNPNFVPKMNPSTKPEVTIPNVGKPLNTSPIPVPKIKQSNVSDLEHDLNIFSNASAKTKTPSKQAELITAGTDKEPPLARVSSELLDAEKQASGDLNSFRSKIDRNPVKDKKNILSNLRTQFIDDVAPLETLEKQITGKVASAENSLYKQARMFKGSAEKAHVLVQEQLQPIFKDIQKKGISTQDLGDYALAVHAKDVNTKGINSGFTNAEIDDVINKLGTPEMEAARKNLLKANNHVLEMLSNGGILAKEQVEAMKEKWPNYVSLFRSFDDNKVEFASGISKAMANASSPIKRLEGSNRAVIDPLESVVKNIFKATNTVDRNNVAAQIGKLAEKDTEGAFIRKLANAEDTSRLNVISVMENGKKVKYEVPPEVYKTMMNLDKESTNTLIKILQKPASILRAGATLTPEFSLRNPLRDVPNAFVVSKSGFNPIVDFPIGLWQSIWKGRTIKIGNKEFKTAGDLYKQFIKENGGYGNIISMDRKLHQQTLKKALTETNQHYVDLLSPKTYASFLKTFSNPITTLRTIADVGETATKVGEFRAALKQGKKLEKKEFNKLVRKGLNEQEARKLAMEKRVSPQEAAYRARDIMDFARAGVSVREANKVVAFLNANIQGKSKLWRAFTENPVRFIGKATAAVTIPTIGAIVAQNTYANDKQREIINDAPQWLKDTFWLVPIPNSDQIARIPKPFDLSFAFSNTIERAFDYVYKHDKEAFDGFIKQGFSQASIPVMLTGLAPLVEGMANYSFFRQSSIIPKREDGVEYPDQYDVNTSEVAKFTGKQINKVTGGTGAFKNFGSPRVIDNTIQGFTGGMGSYATNTVDWFLNTSGALNGPERPAKNLDQKPLARAFLVNQSSGGESLDKLYSTKEQLIKARGSAKQNLQTFKDEDKYQFVNQVTKDLSEMNKEIRYVENSPDLSAKEKRKILDELIIKRNDFAREMAGRLKE